MNPISLKAVIVKYKVLNDLTLDEKKIKIYTWGKDDMLHFLIIPAKPGNGFTQHIYIELYALHIGIADIVWKITLIQDLNANRMLSYPEFIDNMHSVY